MSSLEGNLNSSALVAVLEAIIEKNPASTLLISDGRDEKVVYFSTGGLRVYASEGRRVAKLEEFLCQKGLVSRDQIELAVTAAQESRNESFDEVLDRKGLLPRPKFLEANSELIYLELCDLVTWENAIYEFYEGNPPPEIFDQDHPALFASQDVTALAGKVRDWAQEWTTLRAKLYSERLRPKLLPSGEELREKRDLPAPYQRLYRAIDGQRTLRELAKLSGLAFADAARELGEALKAGHLRATLVAEKESSSASEVLAEIERLEQALDKAINTILIHKRIASGYEKLGDRDRASDHYLAIGNLHAVAGRMAQALESYRQAMTLSPQNITAHETLIRRLQDAGQEDQARVEIVDLSRKLVSFGLIDRALDCLRGIRSKIVGLFDVRQLFGDLLARTGRSSEAVHEYLGLTRDLRKAGIWEGIEQLYLKVLALDPTNQEARQGLSLEQKRQVGKGVVFIHRASAAAATLVVLAWGVCESMARVAWAKERTEIEKTVLAGQRSGLEKLRAIGKGYPATLLASSLLEAEERLFEESFRRRGSDLERAAALRKEGRLSDALELLRTVARSDLVPPQSDVAKQAARDIEAQVREGMELRRNAELFLDARFYEDAFQTCRKVLDRYPELAKGLQMPFFVRSEPSGAEVKVDGVRWGSTPLWVNVPLGNFQEVVVEKPGFAPQNLGGFENRRSPYIAVTLRKQAP